MSVQSKALLPLTLSAKKISWRKEGEYENDSEFSKLRPKILTRDDYQCRHCSFRSVYYQEIHHLNDDHNDHSSSNLVTACSYCHMCHHIGLAGVSDEAILIWLPEIEQIELNHLVRAIQIVSASKGNVTPVGKTNAEYVGAARKVFDQLFARSEDAKSRIGTSSPEVLANVFLRMNDDDYARRKDFLAGIRLLPLGKRNQGGRDIMPEMVAAWCSNGGEYSGIDPKSWGQLLRQYMDALKNV